LKHDRIADVKKTNPVKSLKLASQKSEQVLSYLGVVHRPMTKIDSSYTSSWEMKVRSGQITEVRNELMNVVTTSSVHRNQSVKIAELARRVGLPL
jgi:hypothetical protein